jgi:small subunit ribosomal protein S6
LLSEEARDYELVVVLSPEIADDGVSASLERIQQSVGARGGEVVGIDHWGRRRLAYPIKKQLEGNYVITQIRLDPAQVPDLERNLKLSEEVLRHLIVRVGE